MSIPGYDAWKLMCPEEEHESRGGKICPECGAWSLSQCDLGEGDSPCAWEVSEPDPDYERDLRSEDREFEATRDPRNWGDA